MRLAIVIATALLAGLASAQTVIDVPQGSDVFPTVGQVDCMEPVKGRRYAATYECGDQAGALWGDMASNDGSQAINAASPAATGHGCVVTVDSDAAVTSYRGYRPGGTGEAVGVTDLVGARPPVKQRLEGPASGGSLLEYILKRNDMSIPEYLEADCGHIREGHSDRSDCEIRAYVAGISDDPECTPATDDDYCECLYWEDMDRLGALS